MQIGLACVATDDMIPFTQLAQEAENRGFAALLTGEHSHLPVGAQAWSGGDLPPAYRRILDPFVALGAAATVTSRIRLGTSVVVVPYHDPILLAKQCSTVDHLSGGRFSFGIGTGYVPKEIENHGVPFKRRYSLMRDKMRAVQTIWSNEIASYEGEYVSFTDVQQFPKPVQQPRPPVMIGGSLRDSALNDVIEYGDGWMPSAMMGDDLSADIRRLRHAAEDAGRDPEHIEVCIIHTERAGDRRSADAWDRLDIDEQMVADYEAMGAGMVIVLVPSGPADEVLPVLDRYSAALAPFLAS